MIVQNSCLLTASDFPDPDVIRVGDTYYLVSTTMHFSPSCAILKSHDLLNWVWCGHLLPSLDGTDARRLENGQNCYGKGMWAPSLRFHENRFYICFAVVDRNETHIYESSDLERGPWTCHVLPGLYHDPSLYFENGRVFLIYGNTVIHLTELKCDLSGPLPGGLDRVLIQGEPTGQLGYEGSHFYRIGDTYALFVIHSLPDRWRRVESCFSSDSLTGDFKGGIVFNDDGGYLGQGIAQGGVVDTPDGRWYAVFFQDRGAVGRTPVLLSMHWENGKPVIHKGQAETVNLKTSGTPPEPLASGDTFDAPVLRDMWEWNHVPNPELYRVGNGTLSLTAGRIDRELTDARNTLTVRCTYPTTTVTVHLDGSRLRPGDRAGLCALQYAWNALALCRTEDGFELVLLKKPDSGHGEQVVATLPAESQVTLRAAFDFTDMHDTVSWACLQADGTWKSLGAPLHLSFDLRHFAGVRAGLFCYATQAAGGTAVFSAFTYEP